MTFIEHLQEAREWLSTWSGKLAATAAVIAPVLAENAMSSLGLAEYVPEGWPRFAFLVGVIVCTFLLPLKAQKKDASNG
jgi:hypothetical protein